MGRGKLTDKVNQCAIATLGRPITQRELRLMPYVQHVMLNEQRLDPRKVSVAERDILKDWHDEGWIEGGAAGMAMSKVFWDALCEILWLAYVDYEEDA